MFRNRVFWALLKKVALGCPISSEKDRACFGRHASTGKEKGAALRSAKHVSFPKSKGTTRMLQAAVNANNIQNWLCQIIQEAYMIYHVP